MDGLQRQRDVIAHEAAHAVAAWMYSHPIVGIDCDRPDMGQAGRVDLASVADTTKLRRSARERAVIHRIGGLVDGTSWIGEECAQDRALVREIADALGIPADAFEEIVTHEAEAILRDPRFKPAHRALCAALSERPHERMPGWQAHQLCEEAALAITA